MPLGLFYDLIACHEILNGAEELDTPATPTITQNPQHTGNHDYSLLMLR